MESPAPPPTLVTPRPNHIRFAPPPIIVGRPISMGASKGYSSGHMRGNSTRLAHPDRRHTLSMSHHMHLISAYRLRFVPFRLSFLCLAGGLRFATCSLSSPNTMVRISGARHSFFLPPFRFPHFAETAPRHARASLLRIRGRPAFHFRVSYRLSSRAWGSFVFRDTRRSCL